MDCKCRIVSDGTARNTKVLDAAGNSLDLRIQSISIEIVGGQPRVATLKIIAPHLDLVGVKYRTHEVPRG